MAAPFPTSTQCQIPCCYTYRLPSAGAAQGELPEGQERVPWGMTVPRNSFVGCSLCIPSNFTFIFHSPVSILNLVLFTLNSPLFTLYQTPTSSLLTLICYLNLGQYRIIEQERFASKFCVLTRRGFAVILDVLP